MNASRTAARGPGRRVRARHLLVLAALVLGLLALAPAAGAHQLSGWHWDRTQLGVYNYAQFFTLADNARWDIHYNPHPIWLNPVNYHSSISVYDYNQPGEGYCGWGSIENWSVLWYAPWHYRIEHAHARYNRACGSSSGWVQGVFCQEIGHTIGLAHSATGDCMGLSYFGGSTSYWGNTGAYRYDWDHNSADIYYITGSH